MKHSRSHFPMLNKPINIHEFCLDKYQNFFSLKLKGL